MELLLLLLLLAGDHEEPFLQWTALRFFLLLFVHYSQLGYYLVCPDQYLLFQVAHQFLPWPCFLGHFIWLCHVGCPSIHLALAHIRLLVQHSTAQYVFSKPYHQAIPPGRTQDHIAFQFFPEPTWDHCHNFLTRQSLFLHTPYLWPSYHGATSALLVSCRPVAQ